jgi:L-fuculose-phosphate aldolase
MSVQNVRQGIVQLCIELSRRGHLAGTGGNVAVRVDSHHFAVTPSATDYLSMQPSDVCVLQLDDLKQVSGDRVPSVETGLHAKVLRARPDVQCSIHTHQPLASACALMGAPLTVPDGAWRMSLGSTVPVVGYAPSGSGWLSAKLARALRPDTQAYLMLNHGVLCCGPSVDAAVRSVEDLEALCRLHLAQRIQQRGADRPHAHPLLTRVLSALGLSSPSVSPSVTS